MKAGKGLVGKGHAYKSCVAPYPVYHSVQPTSGDQTNTHSNLAGKIRIDQTQSPLCAKALGVSVPCVKMQFTGRVGHTA